MNSGLTDSSVVSTTRQRVAVRRRRGDHAGRDAAVAARAILHHHGLADAVLQLLRQQARGRVRHAARRIGHDELDGLAGILRLAARRPRGRQEPATKSGQHGSAQGLGTHWILMGRLCRRNSPTEPP